MLLSKEMAIGFIGLGVMGRPIAANLIKAGYKLIVYDQFVKLNDLVSLGAERAVSSKEAASGSEIVIIVLPNSTQVREAILGVGGIVEGLRPGTVVADMSSISQDLASEVSEVLSKKKSSFLKLRVSGGKAEALNGTLSITAEGDKKAFDKIKPVLQGIASIVEITFPHKNG